MRNPNELRDVGYKISTKLQFSTYRPRAERLVHIVDVVVDVVVIVEVIAGGVGSGVVVARVMIRVVPVVVLVMLVQHHRGEHVECLPRTVSTRNVRVRQSFENAPISLLLVSPHDSNRPLRLAGRAKIPCVRFVATFNNKREKIMRLMDGETFKLFITLGESENIFEKCIRFSRKSFTEKNFAYLKHLFSRIRSYLHFLKCNFHSNHGVTGQLE